MDALEITLDLYRAAGSELLDAYGDASGFARVRSVPPLRPHGRCLTVLTAQAPCLAIVSNLSATFDMLARTRPGADAAAARAELEDWCAEMNNQLVGRLKNKLLDYGCELEVGLPRLARRRGKPAAGDGAFESFHFSACGGDIVSQLGLRAERGLRLVHASEGASVQEGAFVRFS